MIRFTQRFIAHHQLWVVFGKIVFEEVDSKLSSVFVCVPPFLPCSGFHICGPICAGKRQREVLIRAKGPLTTEVPRKPKNTCEVTAKSFSGAIEFHWSFTQQIYRLHVSSADFVNVDCLA